MTTRINSKGQVEVINETFAEAFETLNDILQELGEKPVSENVARNDFAIEGGETNAQLQEWARDYSSELASDEAEYRAKMRYDNSLPMEDEY